jgi:hypothetical protein
LAKRDILMATARQQLILAQGVPMIEMSDTTYRANEYLIPLQIYYIWSDRHHIWALM